MTDDGEEAWQRAASKEVKERWQRAGGNAEPQKEGAVSSEYRCTQI